jgi:hypothetical protein
MQRLHSLEPSAELSEFGFTMNVNTLESCFDVTRFRVPGALPKGTRGCIYPF